MVALDNFGSGSSREHAVWALLDGGFRCIIAAGIADIFFANCCKNGVLPVILSAADIQDLLVEVSAPATAGLTADLPARTIETSSGRRFHFDLDQSREADLIDGVDEIGRCLAEKRRICRFESDQAPTRAWFPSITQAALDATAT